jgi:hypothetical protein
VVVLPAVVEALEAARAETNARRGGEIQIAGVKEVEEAVLQDFGPYFEVLGSNLSAESAKDRGATVGTGAISP